MMHAATKIRAEATRETSPRRTSAHLLGLVTVLVLTLAIGGCSGEQSEAEVESVVDAYFDALEATDPEAAAAMFASDGVLIDTNHSEWIGRSEIARFVERYGPEITRCERTGSVEATGDGTFVVPTEFDWRGTEHQREAVFTMEDGLIARADWVPDR